MSAQAATPDASPAIVVMGTATPGGGFPLYGGAVAETVNAVDPSLRIEPRNTAGSTENVPLLQAGKLDIALVQGEVAQPTLAASPGAPDGLSIVTAMYGTPGMFVVKADSRFHSIADLKGQSVALGARGSGLVVLAKQVLDGIGLDADKDFAAVYLDHAGDGPAMVLDGRVAALWGAGMGWPGFTTLAKSPGGIRFIAPDPGAVARIVARHPGLKPMALPAGSYPGQDAPVASVGSWSFILARPGLPDDIAYRLARALNRGEAELARRLPQAAQTTAANTVAAAPRAELIHPGVRRYLGEAGLLR